MRELLYSHIGASAGGCDFRVGAPVEEMAGMNVNRSLYRLTQQASRQQSFKLRTCTKALSTTSAKQATEAQTTLLGTHLKDSDPQIYEILQNEKKRQRHFINLIPSENFTSLAVLEALGSVMQSKMVIHCFSHLS